MKKRVLLLSTLLVISLVGCGAKEESNSTIEKKVISSEPVEAEIPAPTVELMVTPESTSIPTAEATQVPTEYIENDELSCLDGRIHITQNEDGTFNYTDEYIGALAMYNYFDGMTEAEIKEELNFLHVYVLMGLNGKETDEYIQDLTRIEDIIPQSTPVESNTGASESGNNSGNTETGNNNNNSGSTENNNPGNTGNNNSSNNNNVPSQSNPQAEVDLGSSADWDLGPAFEGADTTPIGYNENGKIEIIIPEGATIH